MQIGLKLITLPPHQSMIIAVVCRMQDQLIIFMALASGTSRIVCGQLTLHTRTAIAVAEQLSTAKFTTRRLPTGAWLIECFGAGIVAGR